MQETISLILLAILSTVISLVYIVGIVREIICLIGNIKKHKSPHTTS